MTDKNPIGEELNSSLNPKELLYSLIGRIGIIDERLEEIEEEIGERKEIGEKIMRKKQKKKSEYRGCLSSPRKLKEKAKGDSFHQQQADMREKIDHLDREINAQMENQWKDVQKLTKERRELKEKKEELKRRKLAVAKALGI